MGFLNTFVESPGDVTAITVRLPLSPLMRVKNLEVLCLWEQIYTRSLKVLWLVVLMSYSTCWLRRGNLGSVGV